MSEIKSETKWCVQPETRWRVEVLEEQGLVVDKDVLGAETFQMHFWKPK